MMASRLGAYAVHCLLNGEKGKMVGIQNNHPTSISISEALSQKHTPDLSIYKLAKELSI
jgi:6-phosphofructokinase 1